MQKTVPTTRWRDHALTRAEWRKLLARLRVLFRDFAVEDFSNPREEPAYSALIYLHPDSSNLSDPEEQLMAEHGRIHVLQLHVNRYFPLYYHYTWTMRRTNGHRFSHRQPAQYPVGIRRIASRLDKLLQVQGFKSVSEKQAAMRLPDLDLPCLELGNARVFNVLFGELWNSHFRSEPYDTP